MKQSLIYLHYKGWLSFPTTKIVCQESIHKTTPEIKLAKVTAVQTTEESVKKSTWTHLWELIKNDWFLLLSVTGTAIAAALVNITTPRVIGKLVNIISKFIVSTSTPWTDMKVPVLKLFTLFTAQGILTFIYISLVSMLGERVATRLRLQLYDALLKQDIAFFDSNRTNELLGRLSTDVADFKHSFKQCISQGLKSMTQIAGIFFQLLSISKGLTLMLLMSAPVLIGLGNLYGSYLRKLSKEAKIMDGVASNAAGEALANMKTVRAFAEEKGEWNRYKELLENAQLANEKLGYHIGIFQGFTNFSIGGLVLVVLASGGNRIAKNEMTGGDLMSYLISVQNAQKSLSQIGVIFSNSLKAFSSLGRCIEYIELKPDIPISGGLKESISGEIEFCNVNFSYPSRPDQIVLDNFNLTLKSGEVLSLCGASGSGKSTIGSLIERFYDPNDGYILIDGKDIKQFDPEFLRKNIGYINQEPVLFATTILENIRYAKPDASMDEVERAAKLANAYDFIVDFPDQWNTVVGERGATLSGGQKQRIALARCLLKDPPILIFDEATSALDTTSERIVQEALDRVMKGRTVLIIAHRLSTIENSDRIVVLTKGGKILEDGKNAELLAKKGTYFNLYTNTENQ